MERGQNKLYDLIRMDSPEAVLDEVCVILKMISSDFSVAPVREAFQSTRKLYQGEYPGYRACNTAYHDIHHITAAFLATTRLIHGAITTGKRLNERLVAVATMAALFHDTGYIQKAEDTEGSGAKYTTDHVRRSMDFFSMVAPSWDLLDDEIVSGRLMIFSTELSTDIASLSFPDDDTEFLARILATGDLIGQRADRAYPEKLVLLYHEFKEGNVGNFKDEVDFFRDAIRFSTFARDHIDRTLSRSSEFLRAHFASRWNITEDCYRNAIEKNDNYIRGIAKGSQCDIRNFLRRKIAQ